MDGAEAKDEKRTGSGIRTFARVTDVATGMPAELRPGCGSVQQDCCLPSEKEGGLLAAGVMWTEAEDGGSESVVMSGLELGSVFVPAAAAAAAVLLLSPVQRSSKLTWQDKATASCL